MSSSSPQPPPPPLPDLDPLQIPLPPGESDSQEPRAKKFKNDDEEIKKNQLKIPLPQSESELRAPSNKRFKAEHREDPRRDQLEAERKLMSQIMGFTEFSSTKGKKVPGNDVGSVHVVKKRRYRQYMNRQGGFNRPLDKVA